MSRTAALLLIGVAMIASLVAAAVVLGLVGAKDEVLMLALLLIAAATGFAVSEVVGHYADREKRRPQGRA
jgi:hypothetical protein